MVDWSWMVLRVFVPLKAPPALESTEAYNPYTDKPPKIVTLRNVIMSCFWGFWLEDCYQPR
jgi:hypothetical protein